MLLIYASSLWSCVPIGKWKPFRGRSTLLCNRRVLAVRPLSDGSAPLDYDPSGELLGVDVAPPRRDVNHELPTKLRSWFGPNGQYIRELPCPSCRGRGYTPCAECGIERSRLACSQCNGKGIQTCRQCSGDCVIWEESIDEQPWEKARSSSPLKVKEDEEVDELELKVNTLRKSKRKYQSPSPEVSLKISRSLRSLNEKTGLFSKRMKIIHRDPKLHAQRVAAIKKAKRTAAARKQASETMKAFFSNPENRHKRSIAMKGVKFYCRHCGQEGHRRHYCPTLRKTSGNIRFKCQICGERGHNRRTCGRSKSNLGREDDTTKNTSFRQCKACGEVGHDRRNCPTLTFNEDKFTLKPLEKSILPNYNNDDNKRTYLCRFCQEKGHNIRTCPKKDP
ncbi:putative nucleotidyltransferase, Ribonuclease H [Dioscorea sansibarensis]